MLGIYENNLYLEKKWGLFGVYVTYTYQTTIMWGLGLETWGCNVGTIGNIYFEKNLYSDTNQTHYLGPHIAPLTNTNICWGLYYTRL